MYVFRIYPLPDLTAGILGFGVGATGFGTTGALGLGATGALGFGTTGALGLDTVGEVGFGLTDCVGLGETGSLGETGCLGSAGFEIELSLSCVLGFSTFVSGLSIVCGRFAGCLPSAKVWALLLSAGRSNLLRTAPIGLGTFGVGGTFGAILR
jgi:hypothetical protein